MQRAAAYALLLGAIASLVGCSIESKAERQVKQMKAQYEIARKAYYDAESSYGYARARVQQTEDIISKEQAQREFDRFAANGDWGTSEQLRYVKREIEHPEYRAEQAQMAEYAKRELVYAKRTAEDKDLDRQQKREALKKAETALYNAQEQLKASSQNH